MMEITKNKKKKHSTNLNSFEITAAAASNKTPNLQNVTNYHYLRNGRAQPKSNSGKGGLFKKTHITIK
jgi:hypothetical protein